MSTTTAPAPSSVHDEQAANQNPYNHQHESMAAANDNGPPPTVNTAAVPAFGSMASTMTPTTTNYGFNATLTPLGDDKVNVQKPKQTKKKAAAGADGDTEKKKPTPRARNTTPKGEKAEKRKVNNPSRSTPTNIAATTAMPSAPATTPPTQPPQSAPAQDSQFARRNVPQESLPPSQDIELRKTYLQSIYRQLQMTHRNQDDANVRRLATNIEIEICSRAKTRNEYIAFMNQQINTLMQAELTNGSVGGLQSSLYVPGQGAAASAGMSQGDSTSGSMPTSSSSMASTAAYNQQAFSQSTPTPGQRASTPTQGSFMSLLSGQAPGQSYDASRSHQQFSSAQGRPPPYGAGGPQGYAHQAPNSSLAMKSDTSSTPGQAVASSYQDPRAVSAPPMTRAPPDFASRFQQLNREALIDLLWTQHKTVLQYQGRVNALESQLTLRAGGPGATSNSMAQAPGSTPGGFYNASPRQPSGAPGVPPALSAEAELQRANERRLSRGPQQPPSPYAHPGAGQSGYPPGSQGIPSPTAVQNPAQYWEKVRYLKDGFLRSLYIAHQVLSQHGAPSNSTQSIKAENVKHNISLACTILSETPKAIQPRPTEVLESIERFIHTTVVPIARKVQTQTQTQMPMAMQSPMSGSEGKSGSIPGQQPQYEHTDVPRAAIVTPPAPRGEVSNSNEVPDLSVPKGGAKGAKGAAKAGGKKSPLTATKKATPKTTTPKAAAKAGGKKATARGSAKQANAVASTEATESASIESNEVGVKSNASQDRAHEDPTLRSGGMTDDDGLNDFADFADLDFGDDLPDPLGKMQQLKDTQDAVTARKRSIEDV